MEIQLFSADATLSVGSMLPYSRMEGVTNPLLVEAPPQSGAPS